MKAKNVFVNTLTTWVKVVLFLVFFLHSLLVRVGCAFRFFQFLSVSFRFFPLLSKNFQKVSFPAQNKISNQTNQAIFR